MKSETANDETAPLRPEFEARLRKLSTSRAIYLIRP
jgi:hypothetical protein